MAKNAIVDVGTVSVGGVIVKRWWQSTEIWNAIFGIVLATITTVIGVLAIAAPIALTYLNELGLTPFRTMVLAIVLNLIIQGNQVFLKLRSTSMIGTKTDVQIAKNAAGDETVENGRGEP